MIGINYFFREFLVSKKKSVETGFVEYKPLKAVRYDKVFYSCIMTILFRSNIIKNKLMQGFAI